MSFLATFGMIRCEFVRDNWVHILPMTTKHLCDYLHQDKDRAKVLEKLTKLTVATATQLCDIFDLSKDGKKVAQVSRREHVPPVPEK